MSRVEDHTIYPFGAKRDVRIVIVGDEGSGKSTLIRSAFNSQNRDRMLSDLNIPTLPSLYMPPSRSYAETSGFTMVDTSSSVEDVEIVNQQLRRADVVVITYDCSNLNTLRNTPNWLNRLRQLQVTVPVVVAGCKIDHFDAQNILDALDLLKLAVTLTTPMMLPIKNKNRQIVKHILTSSIRGIWVNKPFLHAQRAVLFPIAPLFDGPERATIPLMNALSHIFRICDLDGDGVLNDAELSGFQETCFHGPLLPFEIVAIKEELQREVENSEARQNNELPSVLTNGGLNRLGFLLHCTSLEKDPHLLWTILRRFGYDDNLQPPKAGSRLLSGAAIAMMVYAGYILLS